MYLYVSVRYSCVTRMYLYVTRMLLVSYSYVPVCTRMYSYVTRVLLVVPVCSFSDDRYSGFPGFNLGESTYGWQ